METGQATEDEMKKIADEGRPLQTKAYQAMIKMADFKGLEVAFDKLMANFFKLMEKPIKDLINWIQRAIRATNQMINTLRKINPFGAFGERDATAAEDKRLANRRLEVFQSTPELQKESSEAAQQLADKYAAMAEKSGDDIKFSESKYLDYYAKTGKMPSAGEAGEKQVEQFYKMGAEERGKTHALDQKFIESLSTAIGMQINQNRGYAQPGAGDVNLNVNMTAELDSGEQIRGETQQKIAQGANLSPLGKAAMGMGL